MAHVQITATFCHVKRHNGELDEALSANLALCKESLCSVACGPRMASARGAIATFCYAKRRDATLGV